MLGAIVDTELFELRFFALFVGVFFLTYLFHFLTHHHNESQRVRRLEERIRQLEDQMRKTTENSS